MFRVFEGLGWTGSCFGGHALVLMFGIFEELDWTVFSECWTRRGRALVGKPLFLRSVSLKPDGGFALARLFYRFGDQPVGVTR